MKRIISVFLLISIVCLTAFLGYAKDNDGRNLCVSISNKILNNGYSTAVSVSADFPCGGMQGVLSYNKSKAAYTDYWINSDISNRNQPEKSVVESDGKLTFSLLGDVRNGISGNWIDFLFKSEKEIFAEDISISKFKGVVLDNVVTATEIVEFVTYGDTNEDNLIDIRDIVRLKKYIAQNETAKNRKSADCNADSKIDSGDLALLRKYLLGYIGTTLGTAENEKSIVYVSEYGAVGDGVTDDGKAITAALEVARNAESGSVVSFDENKTYFVSETGNSENTALLLKNLNGISVKGKNTTVLCDKNLTYMNIHDCVDTNVSGLNFDLKTRAHFVGTVTAVDADKGYFDVVSDRDFGFYGNWFPTNSPFCLVAAENTSRKFITFTKFQTLDKSRLSYRVYADMSNYILGTDSHVKALKNGDKVIVPVPYIGHCGERMFTVTNNENIALKNINVWNAREFVFGLWWNSGEVLFESVNIMPPEDESVVFSSWRDAYHCKSNSARLIWKNCTAKGNGDDIINISANMLYVESVISPTEVICRWKETNGSYGPVKPGESIVIWDVDTGKLIGKTTLKQVADAGNNRYVLNDAINGLSSGENIRFCFESHAAPNSQIIYCDFDGTLRFHGGPLTVLNSKLTLAKLWIDYETYLEGPIPHDILFKNCDFTLNSTVALSISAKSPKEVWKSGDYRLENIKFENCTGLAKKYFENKNNFNASSPDYITVVPDIPE